MNHSTQNIRTDAVTWLIEVACAYKMKDRTLDLGVILMDNFLDFKTVEKEKFQAIAITCLFIANKIIDTFSMSIENIIYLTDNSYNRTTILNLEHEILDTLEFDTYHDTLIQNIKTIPRKLTRENRHLALFISRIVLTTVEYRYLNLNTLAKKIVDFCLLINLSNVDYVIDYDPIFVHLYNLWLENNTETSIIKKIFTSKKYFKTRLMEPPLLQVRKKTILKNNCSKKYRQECFIKSYKKNFIDKINLSRIVGKGTFGVVSKTRINDKLIAIKYITSNNNDGFDSYMIREISSMKLLVHPNIVKLYGYYYDIDTMAIYLFMDFINKPLKEKINDVNTHYKTKKSLILQLLQGIGFMHSCKIMHRDLSINNILVTNDDVLKICDFGSSRYFTDVRCNEKYSTFVCTLSFRALELLLKIEIYNEMVDVWSCACLIHYILNGQVLFPGFQEEEVIKNIYELLGYPHEKEKGLIIKNNFEKENKILKKMLVHEPHERICINEALELFTKCYYENL